MISADGWGDSPEWCFISFSVRFKPASFNCLKYYKITSFGVERKCPHLCKHRALVKPIVTDAGEQYMLLVSPPGEGKTLLARAMPSILPRLTIEEALDVTGIYSMADQLPPDVPPIQKRPFRAPHHTISHAGLVGGGNWPHPGEISLAHRGVPSPDELPEFGPRILEVMRQPIEDRIVTISRVQGSSTFPANFQLIGAMNPWTRNAV